MKNRDEGLNKFETVTTIIVNIGTIISWVITFITALTLIAQPQPITIPGFFELGKPYILIFLICILFGYLQLLRHFWRRSRFKKKETESSFASYLFMSVIKFKNPFVLVGFAIVFISIGQVEPIGLAVVSMSLLLVGAVALLETYQPGANVSPTTMFFWGLDDEFSKRWLKRVRNQLYGGGYVFTSDFTNLNCGAIQINWAIENYFNRYEFEQDLILTKLGYSGHYFLELRFNHLPTRLKKEQES